MPASTLKENLFVLASIQPTKLRRHKAILSPACRPITADVSLVPSKTSFPRLALVCFNCLQIGVGLFRSTMQKWVMAPTAACQ